MTTGKQQPAEPSNSSDDLIAELSKLMAQDAHDSRQAAAAAKPETASHLTPQDGAAVPFAVRIPGEDAPAPASAAPPAPRFDFGRAAEAVATLPREEPAFAAAEPAVIASAADDTANAGQHEQAPEPAPVAAPADAQDHDIIADLIASELRSNVPANPDATATPEAGGSAEAPGHAAWALKPMAANPSDHPAPDRPVLRPVNLAPVHQPEPHQNDSFRVPPVFGLGTNGTPTAPIAPTPEAAAMPGTPAEPAPQPVQVAAETAPASEGGAELDPIDEIESLIGRAVRVELDADHPAREPEQPATSPALRSLATPTLPPDNAPISGVDEAILAAAAATGAQVGWVEHDDGHQTMTVDEPHGGRERAPRRAGMLRVLAGPLVAVVLLLAAGFGLYSVLGLGRSDGPAPVLVADTAPIKSVPDAEGAAEPSQQSIVFNEMDGVVPGAEEQLVSRDQANVNEVTAMTPTSITNEGLANRKVRTVTVRPDGTIVSGGEDSLAGAAILPVDRPNVPEVPGAAAPSDTLLASTGADAMEPTPAAAPVVPLVPGTEIAAIDAAGTAIAGKTAPVPYVRPASVGDAPARGPITASNDEPTQLLPQASTTVANTRTPIVTQTPAPAYAQLSSQRSPEVAQQIARDLSARYASLLNGAQLEVSRADLGARGIYYRVRVPAATQAGAAQFCASVRASGGDCVAM